MKPTWRQLRLWVGCAALTWGLAGDSSVRAQQVVSAPLITAARQGDIRLVGDLLAKGTDPNQADAQGETALHEAAFRGDVAVAEELIAKDAKVNAADQAGITPLHAAAFDGRLEVLVLLVKSGANVRATDQGGFTALHYAASGGFTDIAKRLVAAGADGTAKSATGATPLSMAEKAHQEGVVAYLRALPVQPAVPAVPVVAKKARVVITDDDLPSHPTEAADLPPSTGLATTPGAKTSSCSGPANGGASSGWPSDSGARARLVRTRNELLDSLAELKKKCAEYSRLNDALDNNRPLEMDQVPLALKYEPSESAPTQDYDGSWSGGSFEGARMASRNAAYHLASDSHDACSAVKSMEDRIEALERALANRR